MSAPTSAACHGPGGVESALVVTGTSIGDVADHARPPDRPVEIDCPAPILGGSEHLALGTPTIAACNGPGGVASTLASTGAFVTLDVEPCGTGVLDRSVPKFPKAA